MLQTKASPSCFLSDPTRMKQRECNWVWGISHDQATVDGQASGWGTTERELGEPDRDHQEQGHPSTGEEPHIKGGKKGTSLLVQWLRLHASNTGGPRLHPWIGNQIPPQVSPVDAGVPLSISRHVLQFCIKWTI